VRARVPATLGVSTVSLLYIGVARRAEFQWHLLRSRCDRPAVDFSRSEIPTPPTRRECLFGFRLWSSEAGPRWLARTDISTTSGRLAESSTYLVSARESERARTRVSNRRDSKIAGRIFLPRLFPCAPSPAVSRAGSRGIAPSIPYRDVARDRARPNFAGFRSP